MLSQCEPVLIEPHDYRLGKSENVSPWIVMILLEQWRRVQGKMGLLRFR
jgi:hypothetical protein